MSNNNEPILSDSDDETSINIVGNIPLEWYDEFDHIGYTATGDKVIPKERQDPLQELIRRTQDPNWWRTYYDKREGQYKTITAEELDLVERIKSGRVALSDYNLYQPYKEKAYEDHIHPLTNKMLPKKRFQPSKSTLYKISQVLNAMRKAQEEETDEKKEESEQAVDIWSESFQYKAQKRRGLPPPKMPLPSTDDSYHPPDDENKLKRLMEVEGYEKAIRERYERCSDLYLCPREMQARLPETSSELLPEIPDIEELRPFPTTEAVRFVGHIGRVRCADFSPDGSLIISGGSDGLFKVWETLTGRCLKTIDLGEISESENKAVVSVAYCPSVERPMAAACCGKKVFLIKMREEAELPEEGIESVTVLDENISYISHARVSEFRQCVFNRTGSFLAILGQSRLVYIYNFKDWQYRTPITSSNSYIQCICFHPTKPNFLIGTQHKIIVYDLINKQKVLQLRPQVQWISSIDIHPRGDHVIAGSYDGRSFWFDTELKSEPFKVLRGHSKAVRSVSFNKKFPLFATSSDDCSIQVFHGRVYDDLLTNPLIVPVKELSGHEPNGNLGVLNLLWHPTQPWLVSCGADHTLRLWS